MSKFPPLLIVDYRVLVWSRMLYAYKRLPEFASESDRQMFLNRAWQYVLYTPSSIPFRDDWQIVVVDDGSSPTENYWRIAYLAELGFPLYKGNRKPKPESWNSVANIGYRVIEQLGIPYLRVPGYEADDVAAEFVRQHTQAKQFAAGQAWRTEENTSTRTAADREIFLHTVDTDWLQFVSDSVTWINVAHYEPRIRDVPRALDYIEKKLGVRVNDPYEIVDLKVTQGDRSDNLPAGSPREVIDLLNPPDKYNLKYHAIADSVSDILSNPEVNFRHDIQASAKRWLLVNGHLSKISH